MNDPRARLRRSTSAVLASAVTVLALALAAAPAAAGPGRALHEVDGDVVRSEELGPALGKAAETGRPVLVLVHAVWCPICREMKREVLSRPEIRRALERFHVVRLDIDRSPGIARDLNVRSVPEVVVLDADGGERARARGGMSAEDFAELLEEAAAADLTVPAPSEVAPRESDLRAELSWREGSYRAVSTCFSHVGYGPLDIESQSPLQSLRSVISPRPPSTLARGQWEVSWTETLANVWAQEPDFTLDFEQLESEVSVGYGLSDTWQVEVAFQNRSRFGGILDGFSQGFHDLFGIDQNGRDEVDKGRNLIDIAADSDDPAVLVTDSGSFTRNLLLTVQNNVTCGTEHWPAFAWAATTRVNVGGDDDLNGSGVDLALSAALSRRFGDGAYLYLDLGWVRFGSDEFAGLDLRKTQLSLLTAFEWRYGVKSSLVLQHLVTEGAADDRSDLSDPSHEVTLGWKRELRPGTVLELGLIENVFSFDNSPDFGLHAGVSHRF